MAKSKKIKLFISLFYISAVGLFLYFIFTKFSFQEITSYEFIKNNRDYFYELRQTNLFFLGIVFIFFAALWVFAAGFGSPLALFAGFIFGKWFGLLFAVIGMTIGATLLYICANFFLTLDETVKFFLPVALLLLRSFRPPLVFILDRNPCFFNLFPFFG